MVHMRCTMHFCSRWIAGGGGGEKGGPDYQAPVNARFTLADPMPRLCPDAVGGESGSTHPMHAGPCCAGTPFTLHIGRRARALSADLDQESCSL